MYETMRPMVWRQRNLQLQHCCGSSMECVPSDHIDPSNQLFGQFFVNPLNHKFNLFMS